jgi:hypothetical protein
MAQTEKARKLSGTTCVVDNRVRKDHPTSGRPFCGPTTARTMICELPNENDSSPVSAGAISH